MGVPRALLGIFLMACSADSFTSADAASDAVGSDAPPSDAGTEIDAGPPCIAAPVQKLNPDASCELVTPSKGTLACVGANSCNACDPARGERCSYHPFPDKRPPECTTASDVWVGARWSCDGREACPGQKCCVQVLPTGTACPLVDQTLPAPQCKASCGSAATDYEVCRNSLECSSGFVCTPVETNAEGVKRVLGVCLKL